MCFFSFTVGFFLIQINDDDDEYNFLALKWVALIVKEWSQYYSKSFRLVMKQLPIVSKLPNAFFLHVCDSELPLYYKQDSFITGVLSAA